MAQHYNTKMKKSKNDDGGGIVGKLVTIVFVLILVAGGYFLYTLFQTREINNINLAGQWKLAGNPSWILTINADGTASSLERFTSGETRNGADYTYKLEENNNGVMVLTLYDAKTDAVVEEIKVTKVSQAQLEVIRDGSSFESLTKENLF